MHPKPSARSLTVPRVESQQKLAISLFVMAEANVKSGGIDDNYAIFPAGSLCHQTINPRLRLQNVYTSVNVRPARGSDGPAVLTRSCPGSL